MITDGSTQKDSDGHFKDLIKQRGSIRGRLTLFENFLTDLSSSHTKDITETQKNELNLRMIRIEALFSEFEKCQTQIEVLCPVLDDQIRERESTETRFYSTISSAQSLLKLLPSNMEVKSNTCCSHKDNVNVKLPIIKLPSFEGNYFSWLEFRDTFESLIHKNDTVPDINKFHYLRSSLDGSAALVIKSIEFTSENYYVAWDLLCQRYNNKKILINNHLKALFKIEPITKESYKAIRYLIDIITKNLRALTTLGQPVDQWDTLIIYMVSTKLDLVTSGKWEEYRNNLSDLPLLSEFIEFLRNRADVLETALANCNKNERNVSANHKVNINSKHDFQKSSIDNKYPKSFVAAGYSKSSASHSCPFCNQNHRIIDCDNFKSLPLDRKLSEVKNLRLCVNCLRRGHDVNSCRLGSCRLCHHKHNTLLHRSENNLPYTVTNKETSTNSNSVVVPSSKTLSVQSSSQVLLATALVKVTNPVNKNTYVARILLDAGSQSSFMTENLKHKIGLETSSSNSLFISGINNIQVPISDRCDVSISSLSTSFHTNLNCLIVPQITGQLPNLLLNREHINLPHNVKLADPNFFRPSDVDMLLGAEIFFDILLPERISLGPNMPTLQSTQLGWIIADPLKLTGTTQSGGLHCNFTKEISKNLTKFWSLEELPASKLPLSADDEFCEEHFLKTTQRLENGRFSVSMPFKEKPETSLGDSYRVAAKCFYSLERKLIKNPNLKKQYSDFISEYEALGHLTRIKKPYFGYYLPHHAVVRENSETTKLRVVFNASAKTTSSKSLNDIQHIGPVIQDELFNILLRFRQHKYVFTADIQKCYRQIMIDEKQRNLQLILWRDDPNKPLEVLQLNTVTYGTASAPYLSTRCLFQLAIECPEQVVSEVIKNDCYMDDLLTGADDENTLVHILHRVKDVLDSARFPLHKFRTNCPRIFSDATASDSLNLNKQSSVLGVQWSPNTDTLNFSINIDQSHEKVTKRTILSNTCKIFDPLGLISPCTVTLKILLQKLWQLGLSWDDPVPQNIKKVWIQLSSNLEALLEVSIPRHILSATSSTCELHCFVDASQDAYAACIYARTLTSTGYVNIKLLCAKTRVSPLKPNLTIPRLECSAALLGARLMHKVAEALRCSIVKKVFWSDSTITLSWIKTQPKILKTFVFNRINEIHELTSRNSWRHVPTHLNPADMASRGVNPRHLLDSSKWWEGPEFLKHDESLWPVAPNVDIKLPEIKVLSTALNKNDENNITSHIIKIENYSSVIKLKRILAYVYRFINNCKNKFNKTFGPLSHDEIQLSLNQLIKIAQLDSFNKEITLIKNKKKLTSSLLQFSPYIADDGILRLNGRLNNTNFTFERKHPALLHGQHHLTKLLMRAEHLRLLHAGPQLLLASLRERFWPIGGRAIARRIVRQCVICTRFKAKTMEPLMGHLPSSRVTQSYPFQVCGTDFAGPFPISSKKGRGNQITKCYLCLFICFCTKAIHLEIVSDLTTNAFILCLRRFISRRGKPDTIHCDNGTNFVGASNELRKELKSGIDSIYNFAAEEGLTFKFNPPYSPTFGGLWESGVKSAKHHLKRVLGNVSLTFEELSTLCTQIEAVLNSRPLIPLSSNPSDLSPLTPGHFLIGRPLTSLPAPPAAMDRNIRSRHQLIESLREGFWKRWHNEYLCELQKRTKWRLPKRELREGSMVLFKDEHLPPMKWKMGRVKRLYPGQDGVSRVADFLTIRGVERRALNKVCPLLDDEVLDAEAATVTSASSPSKGPPGCLRTEEQAEERGAERGT